ncbi:hypothetical protein B6R96_35965 (plasmid) [Streptomyces sp. Sge12]|uniref:hypothetical protein n=1 Tax=Streptomyces sp. Sge12 TaxID=1972846 RepID=UPI0009C3B99E|nr:hypothetical protein [Streptomyces sp. Sge12]ARE79427.1 hypothetical protein B6R96_35965 [Streptomyces sp. Sge12]
MDKPSPEPPTPTHAWLGWLLQTWTPIVTSLVALGFSIYNFVLIKPPKVEVWLPHIVRMGQHSNRAYFVVQPTITAPTKSEDVEIITEVELKLEPRSPSDHPDRPQFWWDELVNFEAPPKEAFEHAADPAAIVIAQEKPQQPFFSFVAERWGFKPGEYRGSLTLHRRSDKKNPIVQTFCLSISGKDLEEFRQKAETEWPWYAFRNDDPSGKQKNKGTGRPSDCYIRWDGY